MTIGEGSAAEVGVVGDISAWLLCGQRRRLWWNWLVEVGELNASTGLGTLVEPAEEGAVSVSDCSLLTASEAVSVFEFELGGGRTFDGGTSPVGGYVPPRL